MSGDDVLPWPIATPRRALWLVAALTAALSAPTAWLAYLPMVDLPQVLAAARILQHPTGDAWGFAAHYEPALTTLSWLPYAVIALLDEVMPLSWAVRVLVVVSLLAIPLGLAAILRARRAPMVYALLSLPMVYSGQFYWGLLASQLSLGMALGCIALCERPVTDERRGLALAASTTCLALTHAYGLCLLLGYLLLGRFTGAAVARGVRAAHLAPALIGGVGWAVLATVAPTTDPGLHPTLGQRLLGLETYALGGFTDAGELWLLGAMLALFLTLGWHELPRSAADLAALSPRARADWALLALGLLGYLVLPFNTGATKLIAPRLLIASLTLLPLLWPRQALSRRPGFVLAALVLLSAASIGHAFVQLSAFDREARAFDRILAALPARARVAVLEFDNTGEVARTHPYLHFGGYALAERGGVLATPFFDAAWSIPVRKKPTSPAPPIPAGVEWNPALFYGADPAGYYDRILVRGSTPRELMGLPQFHHELILEVPPWSLYRARP